MTAKRRYAGKAPVSLAYDTTAKKATHPVQPRRKPVDVKAMHKKISGRYPKVLAELAK